MVLSGLDSDLDMGEGMRGLGGCGGYFSDCVILLERV